MKRNIRAHHGPVRQLEDEDTIREENTLEGTVLGRNV